MTYTEPTSPATVISMGSLVRMLVLVNWLVKHE